MEGTLQQQDKPQGFPNEIPRSSTGQAGAVANPQASQDSGPSVRFASNVQEIDPPLPDADAVNAAPKRPHPTPEQLKALTSSLENANLQEQRMKSFSFDPMSLPPSRIPSHETSQSATPQQSHSPLGHRSPMLGPRAPELALASPPLTPADSESASKSQKQRERPVSQASLDSRAITPQASSHETQPAPSRLGLPHRPASTNNISQRSSGQDEPERHHRRGMFSVGPGGQSLPSSRESSPSRHAASQFYTRPFTPQADVNDPYAASRRPAQARASGAAPIDPRFVFSKKKRSSASSSSVSLPRTDKSEKKHSGFFSQVLNKSQGDLSHAGTEASMHGHTGSMSDLRRFFKVGHKKPSSPATSKPGTPRTSLSSGRPSSQVPFANDHDLTSKYGKIGRVLGAGAGGQVKLMRRNEDSTVFAVKEFRPRHSYETEKEYVKKLTAEFCVGSALHHGNIIETLDIVSEKGKWYEVMEYAPYDLFAIVMTGKMSKAEVTCCFLQILSGVTYLHSAGLAHRDLKLDNVVVSEHGIMKIIDFGSAHVFKYPFESEFVLASGVVGSDPYLAPEVYDERKYDPQAVDIWSLAIIYCCMSLRRFPWKIPRMTDNSYKLFASEPTPGHDPKHLILPPNRSTGDLANTPQRDIFPEQEKDQSKDKKPETTAAPASATTATGGTDTQTTGGGKEIIRGPWRLLRLLPRESRHIIGRMLTINPKERATMEEILDEPWVSDTVICRQIGPGQVVSAEDHTHILEPPAERTSK